MVEVVEAESMDHEPSSRTAGYDGRFGEQFDDEVSVSGVVWITIGLAVICALGMGITWGMMGYFESRDAEAQAAPIFQEQTQRMPDGPLLQTDPEGELEAMRHEMAEHLGSYGWVDQNAGTVHIPIDKAMSLLVENGSVTAGGGSAPAAAVEEATE